MRRTDVVIIGGGLAGSTAAAMLGVAGIDTVLVDPHKVYPPDFRCEKLDRTQVAALTKTGLADRIAGAVTFSDDVWIVRHGDQVSKRHIGQWDILYDTLVNTMRSAVPANVEFIEAKATAVKTGADRQTVTLASGEEIDARLIVMAMGLNVGIRHTLGLSRRDISPQHSISIGFDMAPVGGSGFPFPALTYYPERIDERVAYLTIFPIGSTMRANFFVYRDMRDPWLKDMRHAPVATLNATLPGLSKMTGPFTVTSDVKIRPVDLYVTEGHRQPGIVLVGDAFATSCPAAGTGAGKAIVDVERLCHAHIPAWLATPGIAREKIETFYDDPVKVASDESAAEKAQYVRSIAVDTSLPWQLRRLANGVARHVGLATLRDFRAKVAAGAQNTASHHS
jgi:2-polyprenyl-6-methoxyphenol hydroxylase-like FAD-dependent oxidoreductase